MNPLLWYVVAGVLLYALYDDWMRGGKVKPAKKRKVSVKTRDRS